MKKILFAMLSVLALTSYAEDAGEVHFGGPVYPTRGLNAEAVDVAAVLVANMGEIEKQLADNALSGKVQLRNGWLQVQQPLGKNHRIFTFSLEECRPAPQSKCFSAGQLEIHENLFLRPDGEVKTYDVVLDLPAGG